MPWDLVCHDLARATRSVEHQPETKDRTADLMISSPGPPPRAVAGWGGKLTVWLTDQPAYEATISGFRGILLHTLQPASILR